MEFNSGFKGLMVGMKQVGQNVHIDRAQNRALRDIVTCLSLSGHFVEVQVDSRGTEKRTVIVRAENTETTEGKFISLWII